MEKVLIASFDREEEQDFEELVLFLKEKGYINCLVNQLELKDEKAKRVMEEIKKTANEYIENRIKEDV